MSSLRRSSLGPLAVAMSLALLLGFGLARGLQATDDLRGQLDLFSQVLYLVQNNFAKTTGSTSEGDAPCATSPHDHLNGSAS